MRSYTKEETQALQVFRERLSDLVLNEEQMLEANLIRWLRARDLNIEKAEEMFRKALDWRRDHNVDLILNWSPPEIFQEVFPQHFTGFDDEGCLIVIWQGKCFDINVFWRFERDTHIKYAVQQTEKGFLAMRENGSATRDHVFIYDLDGFSIRHVLSRGYLDFAKEISSIMEANYPEITKAVYILNAPRLFTFAWSIIKTFLPAKTVSKVQVLGYSKEQWVSTLLKNLPADQLPVMYGGSNQNFNHLT